MKKISRNVQFSLVILHYEKKEKKITKMVTNARLVSTVDLEKAEYQV